MEGRYVALLRGINVGGNNVISKEDLRACFEGLGYQSVRTYIQSGNILFQATSGTSGELCAEVEAALSRRFDYQAHAVVVSEADYSFALQQAPEEWGETDGYRHNALFVIGGATAEELLASVPPLHDEFEAATAAPGVIFWSVERDKVTRSSFTKLPTLPVYQQVTIRNHNTVRRLAELFQEI